MVIAVTSETMRVFNKAAVTKCLGKSTLILDLYIIPTTGKRHRWPLRPLPSFRRVLRSINRTSLTPH
jgi:hypothetical protein